MKGTRVHTFGDRRFIPATRQTRSCALRRLRSPFRSLPALSITAPLKFGLRALRTAPVLPGALIRALSWRLPGPFCVWLRDSGRPRRAASRTIRPRLLCHSHNPVGIPDPTQSLRTHRLLLLRDDDLGTGGRQLSHHLGIRRRISDHQIHLVHSGE